MWTIVLAVIVAWLVIVSIPSILAAFAWMIIAIADKFHKPATAPPVVHQTRP